MDDHDSRMDDRDPATDDPDLLDAEAPGLSGPRFRLKWVLGGGLLAVGIVGLSAWALASPGAVSYFATPSEIAAGDVPSEGSLRVGGRVAPGTLDRDGTVVSFTVTDGDAEVPVVYAGEVPDTLKEETDVVAEGNLDPDGTLVASRVLAKCSSKFVPADEVDDHRGGA